MPAGRQPWIKVKIGTRRSDKLAGLPDDSARLGYFYLLLEAKTQRRMGVFVGRDHLVDLMGRFGQYFDAWLDVGVLHVAPELCVSCSTRHAPDQLKAGDVVVHDYLLEQRDPTNADRQETWRKLQAALAALEAAGIPLPAPDKVTTTVTPDTVTPQPNAAADVTPQPVTPPPSEHDTKARNGKRNAALTGARNDGDGDNDGDTTKKNVSDGEVDGAKAVSTRDAVDDTAFFSDLNRAGRRGASPGPTPISIPTAIASLTPKWRMPCTNYIAHQRHHRLVDGMAVCDECEAVTPPAVTPVNGAEQAPQKGLGL